MKFINQPFIEEHHTRLIEIELGLTDSSIDGQKSSFSDLARSHTLLCQGVEPLTELIYSSIDDGASTSDFPDRDGSIFSCTRNILLRKIKQRYFPAYQRARTMEGWRDFRQAGKRDHPIAYYIFYTIPNHFSKISSYFSRCRTFIRLRTDRRFHVIKTDLKPGFHSPFDRALHALFTIFVEKVRGKDRGWHLSSMLRRFERFERGGLSSYRRMMLWEHVTIASGGEDVTARAARIRLATEVIALYRWWTVDRPTRIDPYESHEYLRSMERTEAWKRENGETGHFGSGATWPQWVRDEYLNRYTMVSVTEERYLHEDEEMMGRLIKVLDFIDD